MGCFSINSPFLFTAGIDNLDTDRRLLNRATSAIRIGPHVQRDCLWISISMVRGYIVGEMKKVGGPTKDKALSTAVGEHEAAISSDPILLPAQPRCWCCLCLNKGTIDE